MKVLMTTLLLSLTMFGIILGLTFVIPNMLPQIVVGFIVGVAYYLGLSYIFHLHELEECLYLLNVDKILGRLRKDR